MRRWDQEDHSNPERRSDVENKGDRQPTKGLKLHHFPLQHYGKYVMKKKGLVTKLEIRLSERTNPILYPKMPVEMKDFDQHKISST